MYTPTLVAAASHSVHTMAWICTAHDLMYFICYWIVTEGYICLFSSQNSRAVIVTRIWAVQRRNCDMIPFRDKIFFFGLWVMHSCCAQISTCIYSVFCHTQHNYASKVTSLGLFTGHHETYTFKNVWKKLYRCPYNLEKEISGFTWVQKLAKLHMMV
jgi:hypothetical protein